MLRRLFASAVAIGALITAQSACHEPTEIIVRVTTSFDCAQLGTSGVGIRFGTTVPLTNSASAISKACTNGYVGSLVLTPSASYNGQNITVEAVAALAPGTLDADGLCAEGAPGCIRARRTLPYLGGSAITVPITLESSCAGVTCAPSDTCENAHCVPANVDPSQCKTDCSLDGGQGPAADAGPPPAACGDMSGLRANAALPMDRYCPGHVGYSPYPGPASTPSLVHQIPTGLADGQTQLPAALVIDEYDDVYFLTLDAKLHAFSARTGGEKWPAWATQPDVLMQSSGTLLLGADGRLYVGNDQNVLAVDPSSGKQLATVRVPDNVRSTLTSGPAGLYFSGPNRTVETVTLGASLGLGPVSPPTVAQIDLVGPTVAAGRVWVGDGLGSAYSFDASTLATAAQTVLVNQSSAGLSTMAVAPDGTLRTCFISGGAGEVSAFSSTAVLWTTGAFPAVTCEVLAVLPDGTTFFDDDNHDLVAFDASGVKTPYPDGPHPRFPAFDVNRVVYTRDTAGNLVAYSSPTAVVWTSALRIAPWAIYVGTDRDLIAVTDTQILVLK